MTQPLVDKLGEQKSCATPPPLRETDVTEGGMDSGGSIALLVPLSSTMVIDGLCRFIEGSDVCSRSVYVRIGSLFFFLRREQFSIAPKNGGKTQCDVVRAKTLSTPPRLIPLES